MKAKVTTDVKAVASDITREFKAVVPPSSKTWSSPCSALSKKW